MRSALLCASSAEGLFLSVVSKRLRAFRNYFFTGGGRNEKRQLPRRFLRKHGAAGENFLTAFSGKTLSVIAARCQLPREGELYLY